MITLLKALALCRQRGLNEIESRLFLERVSGVQHSKVHMAIDRTLSERETQHLQRLLTRRAQNEPAAYILGNGFFFKDEFHVTPSTLIPRPETELLVDVAIARGRTGSSLLELGTGSGCVIVSVMKYAPYSHAIGLDASYGALESVIVFFPDALQSCVEKRSGPRRLQ
jgi:release factor glutamine methyltransferase